MCPMASVGAVRAAAPCDKTHQHRSKNSIEGTVCSDVSRLTVISASSSSKSESSPNIAVLRLAGGLACLACLVRLGESCPGFTPSFSASLRLRKGDFLSPWCVSNATN